MFHLTPCDPTRGGWVTQVLCEIWILLPPPPWWDGLLDPPPMGVDVPWVRLLPCRRPGRMKNSWVFGRFWVGSGLVGWWTRGAGGWVGSKK